ncbi:unnamed protein product [Acanthosepion pharaonis]|uniref:Uncharacterized protein n=1 Tax=Acanthosepion pharaonis TaxID=158019 RepID=A0A812ENN7_ACAPH|nr:unnamed protein product [Sepia pharaonis]
MLSLQLTLSSQFSACCSRKSSVFTSHGISLIFACCSSKSSVFTSHGIPLIFACCSSKSSVFTSHGISLIFACCPSKSSVFTSHGISLIFACCSSKCSVFTSHGISLIFACCSSKSSVFTSHGISLIFACCSSKSSVFTSHGISLIFACCSIILVSLLFSVSFPFSAYCFSNNSVFTSDSDFLFFCLLFYNSSVFSSHGVFLFVCPLLLVIVVSLLLTVSSPFFVCCLSNSTLFTSDVVFPIFCAVVDIDRNQNWPGYEGDLGHDRGGPVVPKNGAYLLDPENNDANQKLKGRVPVFVHPSLYRALKLTYPSDIGGFSQDDTVENEMASGSMGRAVGVLTPAMFYPEGQP